MFSRHYSFLAAAAFGIATSVALAAQPAAPTGAPAAPTAAELEMRARMPDTRGTGKFAALKEETASLPNHVVYRPANLQSLGATRLGVYVFGNGACVDDGASSRLHLLEIASHGYLAIAPGRIRTGPGATVPPQAEPQPGQPAAPRTRSSYKDLTSALDWALAQNNDASSPYYGRIDAQAVAVSGYSCGGAQAMRVAADPRVRTLVMMNSGLFQDGAPETKILAEMDVPKSALQALHTPVLYVLGGNTDVAYPQGVDDFQRIDKLPVFIADLQGVGHGGTYWQPDGGKAATVVVAWLDWQLRGNTQAANAFRGKNCGLCNDAAWKVQKKRID